MKLHGNARTNPFSRRLLVERIESGDSVRAAAEAVGVSRSTAYKWLRRWHEEGEAGLQDRSSAPHRIPHKTPARLLRRYERQKPGELLHFDVKKLGRFRRPGHRMTGRTTGYRRSYGAGWDFLHVCVDDCTRLAYVEIHDDERKETATGFLRRAVTWFRRRRVRVDRVLTDNGSCYRSHPFAQLCRELGIRHLRTRPYRPETNGKAERFIQTLVREWAYARQYRSSNQRAKALAPWLAYYNREHPHGGIGYETPVARLRSRVSTN